MGKLVRRIATAAASLAIAGGALFAAGGSATAATLPAEASAPIRAGAVAEPGTTGWAHGRYEGGWTDSHRHHWSPRVGYAFGRYSQDRFYPWVWDQLITFGYVR